MLRMMDNELQIYCAPDQSIERSECVNFKWWIRAIQLFDNWFGDRTSSMKNSVIWFKIGIIWLTGRIASMRNEDDVAVETLSYSKNSFFTYFEYDGSWRTMFQSAFFTIHGNSNKMSLTLSSCSKAIYLDFHGCYSSFTLNCNFNHDSMLLFTI